mgnify:CR=1 FL=1
MSEQEWTQRLTEMLKGMGHSDEEIEKILVRVARYDEETSRDSVMDSLGSGSLNLDALIKEALDDEGLGDGGPGNGGVGHGNG